MLLTFIVFAADSFAYLGLTAKLADRKFRISKKNNEADCEPFSPLSLDILTLSDTFRTRHLS